VPVVAVAVIVAVAAAVVWQFGDRGDAPGSVTAPAATGPTAAPPRVAGNERTLLLHAISLGPPASASISMAGVPERDFRVGETIAPGLRLAAIAANRVTIDAEGRQLVLTLEPGSGRPGDRVGLDPEPATIPQLSGAEIERRQARVPVRKLPEEEGGAPR
jgi:hypothetical protein